MLKAAPSFTTRRLWRRPPSLSRGYAIVRSADELEVLIGRLREAGTFSLSAFTHPKGEQRRAALGYAFGIGTGEAWYVPVGHVGLEAYPQLSPPALQAALKTLLDDSTPTIHAHNAKALLHLLADQGIDASAHLKLDVMLASYLVDAGKYAHSLSNIALDRLNHKMLDLESITGKGRSRRPLDELAPSSSKTGPVSKHI